MQFFAPVKILNNQNINRKAYRGFAVSEVVAQAGTGLTSPVPAPAPVVAPVAAPTTSPATAPNYIILYGNGPSGQITQTPPLQAQEVLTNIDKTTKSKNWIPVLVATGIGLFIIFNLTKTK